MIEEDKEDIVRFSSRHIKELFIMENDKGFVDTIYRKFKMPAQSIVAKFSAANVSTAVLNLFKKNTSFPKKNTVSP